MKTASGLYGFPGLIRAVVGLTPGASYGILNSERRATGMEPKASRQAKDHVFVDLFNQKKYCLQLFNALHPEAADVTEDDISNISISHVIVDRPYNDLGFMVRDRLLVLVEAQATWSYNILIRILLYLTDTWMTLIRRNETWDIHDTAKLRLPKPEFYVIYTGDRDVPERISLGRDFFADEGCALNLEARVISAESTRDIIGQYIIFAHVFDRQVRKYGYVREAAEETIRICRDRGVLSEYLKQRQKEVVNGMIVLFEQEFATQRYGNRMKAEGRAEADVEAAERDRRRVLRMYAHGDTPEKIAENMELSLDQVKQWLRQ